MQLVNKLNEHFKNVGDGRRGNEFSVEGKKYYASIDLRAFSQRLLRS